MKDLNKMTNKERILFWENELKIMEKMKAKPEILDGIRKELAYERMSSKEYEEKELQMMNIQKVR